MAQISSEVNVTTPLSNYQEILKKAVDEERQQPPFCFPLVWISWPPMRPPRGLMLLK